MSNPPAIAYLDGPRLARGLRCGIARVLADRERLNKINVYPVADGDTGTNIASTLHSVLHRLDHIDHCHAGVLLSQVADAALDGARGNSGAILAQFFQGLGDAVADRPRLYATDLAVAVRNGADTAREALTQPREGTILTVIADYATALGQHSAKAAGKDIAPLMQKALQQARQSLANTPNLLDVLRKAGVVDAGAQGFVDLLEGMQEYISTGDLRTPITIEAPTDADFAMQAAGDEEDLDFRYCTECMVEGPDVDRRRLRERVTSMGSSVVIAGTFGKARIHIHTDDPDEVFRAASEFGEVTRRKADDMRSQQALAHADQHRIAIVTDSAADIAEEIIDRHHIHSVPLRVHFGDEHYLDKVSMTPAQFFDKLTTSEHHPTTSQPPPADLRRNFDFLTSHFNHVISLHVTGWASGTLQAAHSAASRCQAPERTTVIDTRNVSVGQGLLVQYAAECADAGFDVATIERAVQYMIPRTQSFGVLDDLKYGVAGGRVPRYVKTIADALRLRPVLSSNAEDGKIAARTALFGFSNRQGKFARLLKRRVNPNGQYRILIAHTADADGAEQLAEHVRSTLTNVESVRVTVLGTALGVHGGPGLLVAGLQEYIDPATLLSKHLSQMTLSETETEDPIKDPT